MSKELLHVSNLSLVFDVRVHHSWTARDVFVNFMKDPVSAIMKRPDKLIVLNNISFKIHKGDRIALMGVNGAGKTTLCRCLAGIYKPTRGVIKRQGQIRAIFDTAIGVYPELTGRENAMILCHFLFPGETEKYNDIVDEALEFSELGQFVDTAYRTYSNGMKARLCLSLVTAVPSNILILDEVFDGADQFWREKISQRTLSVIQRSGAVVFVSHSEEQIKRVCNRALVLNSTGISFDGKPDEACEYYKASSH